MDKTPKIFAELVRALEDRYETSDIALVSANHETNTFTLEVERDIVEVTIIVRPG